MRNDLSIYLGHALFWGAFILTRAVLSARDKPAAATPATTPAAASAEEKTAPFSKLLLTVHMIAFGILYGGIAMAVSSPPMPPWFAGQRLAGFVIIAAGAALAAWALVHFRSWRFRAKLEKGHQLATDGPFALVRHPIYAAL